MSPINQNSKHPTLTLNLTVYRGARACNHEPHQPRKRRRSPDSQNQTTGCLPTTAFGLFCLCIRSLLPCVLLTRCSLLRLIVVTHVGHVRRVTGQGVVKVNAGAGPVMGGARFSLGRQAPRAENFDPEHLLAEDYKGRSLAARCVFV